MAPILTPKDVVRRIAAECAFIDEHGAVGIRLERAAAIVRQYPGAPASAAAPVGETAASALSGRGSAALQALRVQAANHTIAKAPANV